MDIADLLKEERLGNLGRRQWLEIGSLEAEREDWQRMLIGAANTIDRLLTIVETLDKLLDFSKKALISLAVEEKSNAQGKNAAKVGEGDSTLLKECL